jgi:deoxyadenosine/deoxycytidine kinase
MSQFSNTNTKIISIEGNIGSGKSTLIEYLKDKYKNNNKIVFLREPVDEWESIKDENGINMLEKFYADQEKYSFPFQMMAYISRLDLLKKAVQKNPGAIIVTERSLFTDKMVFARMLFDSDKIESVSFQIYLKWFHTFADEFPIHKIIYVKTNPEICNERINKRSRDGESNIPLDYLITCDKYHNDMLDLNEDYCVCKDQIVLDGNIDIHKNENQLDDWYREIDAFIFKFISCV